MFIVREKQPQLTLFNMDSLLILEDLEHNTIHWINHYVADSVFSIVDTHPLNSNLSSG